MRRILAQLWRYRWRVAIGLTALLVVDLAQVLVPRLSGSLVDALARHEASRDDVARVAALVLALGMVTAGGRFFWRWFLIGASRRIRRDLRRALYAHLVELPAEFYARTSTGELMALATNDVEAVQMACGFGLVAFADAVILVTFTLGAMALIDPRLMALTFLPLPVLSVLTMLVGRATHRRFTAVQEAFGALSENVRETVAGVRVVKAYGRERAFLDVFAAVNERNRARNLGLARLSSLFDPLAPLFAGISMLIVLWIGGRWVIESGVSLGQFVAFLGYLGLLVWPMSAFGMVVNLVQRGRAAMTRIDAVLRTPGRRDDPRAAPFPADCAIACRDLSFTYPGAHRAALDAVSFEIPAGRTLGVVGPIGSGKSTLAQLILRAFDPPPGAITIGGTDARAIRLVELRHAIALAPQEPFVFSATVRDNIAFGRPEASDAEVEEAARIAGVHDEVMALPFAYHTVLGERGVDLSGGQKQRISLARALLMQPKLLVLDDALSAVDAHTEERILASLRGVLAARTAVVISHRISAVRAADLILVLDHGRVVERGRHDELVAQGGLYARLDELQRAREALGEDP